ncbi:MAG: hypothetical protein GY847_18935 [Proteobacteria bacterium]|nr:hypothetical protein [Pseudomonadota bacterium]
MKKNVLNICLAGLLSASCADDFEKVYEINKLRVMAISAEPPEISPGQGATLHVLYADPKGGGREVQFAWMICAGLIHPSEGAPNCESLFPPQIETAANNGDIYTIPPIPPDLLDSLPPGETSFKATVILVMCAGGSLPIAEELMSKKDIEKLSELCVDGDGLSAFKTVTVSNSNSPNTNPMIDYLMFDDELLEPGPNDEPGIVACKENGNCDTKADIKIFLTRDSGQEYEIVEFGETEKVEERLYVSWFVTNGEFDEIRSSSPEAVGPYQVEWEPEKPGTSTLYVVAHDIRGGVSWNTYTIETRNP